MKMYCATTAEIDDAEYAVAEILEQLNLAENLLKNATLRFGNLLK